VFLLQSEPLPSPEDLLPLADHACGGVVTFVGRVRDHHEGRAVTALEYEAYEALALAEGARILEEAAERFSPVRVVAAHRHGRLGLGEAAVVVVAASAHRQEAFEACRWVIDAIKDRLPVWKREHYADGTRAWVACGCHHHGTEAP
jgi:molybdopterin synthase catalytic subunit